MTDSKSGNSKALLVGTLVGLLGLPVVLLILISAGQINGQEFSPDDFSRRSFSYNRLPWVKVTIGGLRYQDITPLLEQTLVADGWITPLGGRPKTWHLVFDTHTPRESPDCDARLLCDYLDMIDQQGNSIWLSWNQKHTQTGKLLWSKIADLARNEFYLPIPQLMRYALDIKTDDPVQFRQKTDEIIAQAYFAYAIGQQEQDRHQDALKYFTRSIAIRPTARALRGRAHSHAELGNSANSRDDLATASRLPDS